MKALCLEKSASGPESARLIDVPQPEPAAGEARVALRAAALNHREIWISRGQYPGMILPTILGADGAGVVDRVGDGVEPTLIGQAVILYPGLDWGENQTLPSRAFGLLGMPGPGTIAESICIRADRLVPKPSFLTFEEAAAWPLAGLTAWRALFTKARLRANETLLVTGAGGGVAGFAVQLAVAAGASVFVTSSSDESIARAMAAGAKGGINYRAEGWGRRVKELTGEIDVVIDGAPAAGYQHYGRALSMGARIIVYGASGGAVFPVKAAELFLKNIVVHGTNVGTLGEFREMLEFVDSHCIAPAVDRVFPLDEAHQALCYLDKGHRFGKVVVTIS